MSLATRILEESIIERCERAKSWATDMEQHRVNFENARNAHDMTVNEIKTLKEALNALTIRAPQQ